MSKTKFSEVINLITAVIDLIRELVPIAGDALALVQRISQVVKDFKAELTYDSDAVPTTEN